MESERGGYRYGFNGKENDNEVKGEGNQQDYGMRVYDPRVGKFLSVDPQVNFYSHLAPYLYAADNPIFYIDVEGMSAGSFSSVDPPTKRAPTLKSAPTERMPDPHRVEEGGQIIRKALKVSHFVSNNPWVLFAKLIFQATPAGEGSSKPETNQYKILERITTDPGRDLSDAEKKAIQDRIDRGAATDNDRLYISVLQANNSKIAIVQGRIAYENDGGQMIAKFNRKRLGFYEYSEEKGLEFDLTIPKELQKMGLGTEIFKDAMKATNAKKFSASWRYGSLYEGGMSTNLKIFLEGLSVGKEAEEAAWDTPSGEWAKQNGFKHVKIENKKYGVDATFTK